MFANRGITITEKALFFEAFPVEETGKEMYCKSFRISLKKIKYISINTRFVLDDDVLFIQITSKNNKVHNIPYTYDSKDFDTFEKHFQLNPIYQEELKFECGDYTEKINKIIYPKEMYWQDVPQNSSKLTLQNFFLLFDPKSILGDFNNRLTYR